MRLKGGGGFSLIEVLAALFIFSLVTLGVIPLFATALRGSNVSREFTVGKNVAVQAMERMRGLPFHRSETGDLDVLDIYHPGVTQPFVTTCTNGAVVTAQSSTGPDLEDACPRNAPAGYTVKFSTSFVRPDGTAITDMSTYLVAGEVAEPPSGLLRVIITSSWQIQGGRTEDYVLESLLSDVRFGRLQMRGVGEVDYGVRVLTSYNTPTVNRELVATAGTVGSTLQLRSDPGAELSASAGSINYDNVTDPDATQSIDVVDGATLVMNAPPDDTSGTVIGAADVVSLNGSSGGAQIAGIDANQIFDPGTGLEASVASNLPLARGAVDLSPSGSSTLDMFVDQPQAERGPGTQLQLVSGAHLVTVNDAGGTTPLRGSSSAVSQLTRVDTEAHVNVGTVAMLPTSFAPAGVIQVANLDGDAVCNTVPGLNNASSDASATWSATMFVWTDDGTPTYESFTLGTGQASLETIASQGNNIKVYQDLDASDSITDIDGNTHDPDDLFLFPETFEYDHDNDNGHLDNNNDGIVDSLQDLNADGIPDLTAAITFEHGHYFEEWQDNILPTERNNHDEGRVTTAQIPEALRFETANLPAVSGSTASSITISMGSLGCEAVDFR